MPLVLIVDDEADFCYFVKKNLELRPSYEVRICTEAKEAFETIKKMQPDLVILDIIQPEMTGGEIAEAMRAHPQTEKIPFVFLTAVVQERETQTKQDIIGGHYFISKPVKVDKLVEIIEKVLADK